MKAALILAAVLIASTAAAQMVAPVCGPRKVMVERLEAKFGEVRQSGGVNVDGRAMETYANRKTGTWSLLLTNVSGTACLVAGGQYFEVDAQPKGDPA